MRRGDGYRWQRNLATILIFGGILRNHLTLDTTVFRSPGLIHYPSVLGAGGRDHPGLFHVADFLPTLVSLVAGEGEAELGTLDGVNQVVETAD